MEPRFPHLECEYSGGHLWRGPLVARYVLLNQILIDICLHCGEVRPAECALKAAA